MSVDSKPEVYQQEQQQTEGDRTLCSKSTGTHLDSFLKPVSKYSDRKAESSGSIVWNVLSTINTRSTFSDILGIKDEMSSLRKIHQMGALYNVALFEIIQ